MHSIIADGYQVDCKNIHIHINLSHFKPQSSVMFHFQRCNVFALQDSIISNSFFSP